MKKIEGKDVGYKCISCGGIGILSYTFPLCNRCINLWDILLKGYKKDEDFLNKLMNLFDFLKNEEYLYISSSHDEIQYPPSGHIDLGTGSRNINVNYSTINHLIVLSSFRVDDRYERTFGDYLCNHSESQRAIKFSSSESNLCKSCVSRLKMLKKRFSVILIHDEYKSYESYYNRYWGLINILYKYYIDNKTK